MVWPAADCRLPTANPEATDGPFATLVKARDAVRQLNADEVTRRPATVLVRGGKYFLGETSVLSAIDGRTRDCPVTGTAYLHVIYHYSGRLLAESDYNLFFNAVGRYELLDHSGKIGGGKVLPLEEWQRLGYDTHSIVADPMFVDPENGDYRPKPESPAYAIGFAPIPIERTGIRSARPDERWPAL